MCHVWWFTWVQLLNTVAFSLSATGALKEVPTIVYDAQQDAIAYVFNVSVQLNELTKVPPPPPPSTATPHSIIVPPLSAAISSQPLMLGYPTLRSCYWCPPGELLYEPIICYTHSCIRIMANFITQKDAAMHQFPSAFLHEWSLMVFDSDINKYLEYQQL